ncbi:MAG TPA: excinuclease ABC subunit UvrA [Myxococcota bacterium]|nr:excinuclease ABC subunit UvrA [Myxococcota bacterium]
MSRSPSHIEVRGAREHNLRGIDVRIPRDALVVITGLSGSGKSSLAFDTIYAEGQRRYVESLSAYARQFLEQMAQPEVESIEGLSPAISIEQRTTSRNPRSTVGTTTEVHDYLRLLYARIGRPHCWSCGRSIASQTPSQITERVLALGDGTKLAVLAPVVRGRKGEYRKELDAFRRQGFVRVRIDGELRDLSEEIRLAKTQKHDIDVVVDRLAVKEAVRARIAESVGAALRLADGLVRIDVGPGREEWLLSERNACAECGTSFPELEPRSFSFNSPHGACPRCGGLGTTDALDPARVVPDPERALGKGAIAPWGSPRPQRYYAQLLASLAHHFGVSLETPWRELPAAVQKGILEGTGREEMAFAFERGGRTERVRRRFDGVLGELERRRRATEGEAEELARYCSPRPCPECDGARLRVEARSVRLGGGPPDARGDGEGALAIHELSRLPIAEAREFLAKLRLGASESAIAERIRKEILDRLRFLGDVGLDYLTLDRPSASLSGGEGQRIRLATQVGSSLMGVLYVLDEPSIGLHPRDNERLLASLGRLRDVGNSVLVVEHDEATIRAADWVIDMGPGAGIHGGEIVAEGTPAEIAAHPDSCTGAYLSGRRRIEVPRERRAPGERWLTLSGCREHNLQDVTLRLPLGLLCVVTGVSGSGKSTLVSDTLHRALAQRLHGAEAVPGRFDRLEGVEQLDKVIDVDQAPIGRTPRSNPATYVGLFDGIRALFAQVPEARVRGYGPGRFSFNVKGGRCESCGGDGLLRVEMHFLPDLFVTCEVCGGKRYNRETLEIRYKGRTIADVLAMTVEEALSFFENVESLRRPLATLHDVGLDYVQLGQPATTLSGGEAQRVKLASELARRSTGRTLYLLDEPTTGLHFADVERLLEVLEKLVALGNTVVVIEHHVDVIKRADWVVDLGPEGGAAGGRIVVEGRPEIVAACAASHTGRALVEALDR